MSFTMKQVSILTLHFYDNFGSVLQAWALQRFISEELHGIRGKIIPFRPAIPDYTYFSDPELQRRFQEKQELFRRFRQEELDLNEDDGGNEILDALDSDIYITGSDIVWSREYAGLHPAYFLDFVKLGAKRVAYAASMMLKPGEEAFLARYLPDFDAVSIREKADIPRISKYVRVPVKTVLDPTLLLTQNNYSLLEQDPENLPDEPYLLFYSLTHDPAAVDAANLMAKRFGLRIVHYLADYPASLFPTDAKCFAFCGPREFLSYVKHATLIFTNSYHGTIFSILYHRPFYTQVTRGKMSVRTMELTATLGLEARRYTGWCDLRNCSLEHNWSVSDEKLEQLRGLSKAFLKHSLEE